MVKTYCPFIKGEDSGYPHEYLYWRNNGHQPYIENGVSTLHNSRSQIQEL